MPGTERSLALNEHAVERSDSGDRAERDVSQEHLVLPLRALNVHIRQCSGACTGYVGGARAGGVYLGCTWRGVPGVYIARPRSY